MAIEITTPTRTADWYIDNNNYLVINILEGTSLTVPTGDPAVAVLNYLKIPDTLHEYTDEPVIDKRWHEAIVCKAIEKFAYKARVQFVDNKGNMGSKVGDFQMASAMRNQYMEYVNKAQKLGEDYKDGSSYNVKGHNY